MANPKGHAATLTNMGKGRPKGATNKMTRTVKAMVEQVLADNPNYLQEQANENPAAFLSLVGKVIPLQIEGSKDAPLVIVTRAE